MLCKVSSSRDLQNRHYDILVLILRFGLTRFVRLHWLDPFILSWDEDIGKFLFNESTGLFGDHILLSRMSKIHKSNK